MTEDFAAPSVMEMEEIYHNTRTAPTEPLPQRPPISRGRYFVISHALGSVSKLAKPIPQDPKQPVFLEEPRTTKVHPSVPEIPRDPISVGLDLEEAEPEVPAPNLREPVLAVPKLYPVYLVDKLEPSAHSLPGLSLPKWLTPQNPSLETVDIVDMKVSEELSAAEVASPISHLVREERVKREEMPPPPLAMEEGKKEAMGISSLASPPKRMHPVMTKLGDVVPPAPSSGAAVHLVKKESIPDALPPLQGEKSSPAISSSHMAAPPQREPLAADISHSSEMVLGQSHRNAETEEERLSIPPPPDAQDATATSAALSEAKTHGERKAPLKPPKMASHPESTASAPIMPGHRMEPSPLDVPTSPPHPSPSGRFHLVEQIIQKLETMQSVQGEQRITLHLQPEHLGDLYVSIAIEKDHISAHILAESRIVQQAVVESKEQLRTALAQRGFILDGLDVSLNHGGAERRFPSPLPEPYLHALFSGRPIRMREPATSVQLIQARIHGRYISGRLNYVA